MIKWLKFTFAGFFKKDITKEAVNRSGFNYLLGLILAIVFLYLAVYGANLLPFYPNYSGANEYKEFVYNALYENSESVNISVEDGIAKAGIGTQEMQSALIANTFDNTEQKERYGVNGYDLVIDTRAANAFDDFEAYCVTRDGKSKIPYEEYLALTDTQKQNYDFKITYTDKELVLTEERVAGYEKWLNGLSATDNTDVVKAYADLLNKKDTLSETDYRRSVYVLYAKAYYPDLSSYESASTIPLLRNYYYQKYLNAENAGNYLFIFSDTLIGSFDTGKTRYKFYGFFDNWNGLVVENGISADVAKASCDKFIKNSFNATTGLNAFVCFVNYIKFVPIIFVAFLIVAVITMIIARCAEVTALEKFNSSIKTVGNYITYSSLFAAVATLLLSLVTPANFYLLGVLLFAGMLLLRSVIIIVQLKLEAKKQEKTQDENF